MCAATGLPEIRSIRPYVLPTLDAQKAVQNLRAALPDLTVAAPQSGLPKSTEIAAARADYAILVVYPGLVDLAQRLLAAETSIAEAAAKWEAMAHELVELTATGPARLFLVDHATLGGDGGRRLAERLSQRFQPTKITVPTNVSVVATLLARNFDDQGELRQELAARSFGDSTCLVPPLALMDEVTLQARSELQLRTAVSGNLVQIKALSTSLEAERSGLQRKLDELSKQLDEQTKKTTVMVNRVAEQDKQLAHANKRNAQLSQELDTMLNSNSWRISRPLRNVGRVVRSITARKS